MTKTGPLYKRTRGRRLYYQPLNEAALFSWRNATRPEKAAGIEPATKKPVLEYLMIKAFAYLLSHSIDSFFDVSVVHFFHIPNHRHNKAL